MGYKTPKDIARAGVATGATKPRLSWDKALVAGFLAGAGAQQRPQPERRAGGAQQHDGDRGGVAAR